MTPDDSANVIRAMIRHEDSLMVGRTTWMITLQGLLFAALAFSWDKGLPITLLFIALGILFSFIFSRYLRFADRAISKLLKWWEPHSTGYDGPPVIGLADRELSALDLKILPWKILPYLFIGSWLIILVVRLVSR